MYRVLMVHNRYGRYSGEEAVVDAQVALLEAHGHEVCRFERSSSELDSMAFGRSRALFSGIYSVASKRRMADCLVTWQPDVVHVHNLFPLISPSVLVECRKANVPVVMSVHNYRLVCPNGLHMPKRRSTVCERCCGGREYWCALQNCEGDVLKSVGYWLRATFARKYGFFKDNVTIYMCLTEFQRARLAAAGFPTDRLVVIPNMVKETTLGDLSERGDYVAFVGRVSPEKGIECLMRAARKLPSVPFKIAGHCESTSKIAGQMPSNMEYLGRIPSDQVPGVIEGSRFIVFPSICFEGYPMTIAEAMMAGKAVVASRIGGIPSIVADGATGLLCEPGNVSDLAEKMEVLWENPELNGRLGYQGRQKMLNECHPQKYYQRLMAVYSDAKDLVTKMG